MAAQDFAVASRVDLMTQVNMKPHKRKLALQGSDLRGLSRLGVDAILGITNLVEALHHSIASAAGIFGKAPPGRTTGFTGGVYRTVRGTTRLAGKAGEVLLGTLTGPADDNASTPMREAVIAALNGVWGDHLAESANPLAIPMHFRINGQALNLSGANLGSQLPAPSGKIMVLVHGLCMNDLQWTRKGHNHGLALAQDLGFTPVFVQYNSGRHVSQNGRELAGLLEQLVAQWPVAVEELVIVGHSMGGMVARSACYYGGENQLDWLAYLTKMVFLGVPHHGAPLERGGHFVTMLFGLSPYAAPFGRLGRSRSAGITDLRFGNLQDLDWQERDRHAQRHDDRHPTPLPAGVQISMVAATTSDREDKMASKVLGDGLVPLTSALGEHANPAMALSVPSRHQLVVTSANHWDLLSRPDVYAQMRTWLSE